MKPRRLSRAHLFAPLVLFSAGACAPPEEAAFDEGGTVVAGEVLLRLPAGIEIERELRETNEHFEVAEIEQLGNGWVRLRYRAEAPPELVARSYGSLPTVDAAQANIVYQADATPNDPRFSDQYSHRLTQAATGWNITTGDRAVIVAVIGDGIDLEHPDLVNNLWRNAGEQAGDRRDNDGNGFVDDVYGWDFKDGDSNPRETAEHHETAVAGVVGAEGNNGRGVSGVAWRVSLMTLRVQKVSSDVARAIDYAVQNGASVINMSMSSPTGFRDALVTDALARAEAGNVVVVSSVGNLDNDTPRYPAAFPTVVGVASTTSADRRAPTSCYGSWVDVAAPGDGVLTTYPNGGYNTAGGTSYAAPYVAGVAALLLARDPRLTAAQVRTLLTTTGDALSFDRPIGRRINVAKALGQAPPPECGGGTCPTFTATFSGLWGNNWWIEADVSSSTPIAAVEARADGGPWYPLRLMSWGPWVGGLYMPTGSVVELRAISTAGAVALSGRYLWPSATLVGPTPEPEPEPEPTPAPSFTFTVEQLRGNNWWLEATVSSAASVTSLEVRVDGGAFVSLKLTTWGPWVGGVRMPDGSRLELRATSSAGAVAISPAYRWPDGVTVAETPPPPPPPPQDGFEATFSNFKGNNWWLEVNVSANAPLASVYARVDGGAWVALTRTSWGPWVGGVRMPSGSTLEVKAVATDGREDVSDPRVWSI